MSVEAWSESQVSSLAWDDVGVRVSRRMGHFLIADVLRQSINSAVSAAANLAAGSGLCDVGGRPFQQ